MRWGRTPQGTTRAVPGGVPEPSALAACWHQLRHSVGVRVKPPRAAVWTEPSKQWYSGGCFFFFEFNAIIPVWFAFTWRWILFSGTFLSSGTEMSALYQCLYHKYILKADILFYSHGLRTVWGWIMPWVLSTSGPDKALSFRTGGLQWCVKMWILGRKICCVWRDVDLGKLGWNYWYRRLLMSPLKPWKFNYHWHDVKNEGSSWVVRSWGLCFHE